MKKLLLISILNQRCHEDRRTRIVVYIVVIRGENGSGTSGSRSRCPDSVDDDDDDDDGGPGPRVLHRYLVIQLCDPIIAFKGVAHKHNVAPVLSGSMGHCLKQSFRSIFTFLSRVMRAPLITLQQTLSWYVEQTLIAVTSPVWDHPTNSVTRW